MKIFVKTLRGSNFEIEVKPEDSVADVKKIIETCQGSAVYPASQQMLIHQGKELNDGTLVENKVAENSYVVIMLTKSKSSPGEVSGSSTPGTPKVPQPSAPSMATTAALTAAQAPIQPATVTTPPPVSSATTDSASDPYGLAASDRVAGTNLEGTVQQILDLGGGTWDKVTVLRALRSAFNNPARAIDYLYSGIPEQPEAPPAARIPVRGEVANLPAQPPRTAQPASTFSSGPNANPLNLFPQGLPNVGTGAAGAGTLDFLRDSQQFRALRVMVQANPQILQPMLLELGKQNPNLMRLISQNRAAFHRLINEPEEGREGNILGDAIMPQSVSVTSVERAAIERLEAMGFNRATVLEVFFACNKNEELAANYLLDHMNEFDD